MSQSDQLFLVSERESRAGCHTRGDEAILDKISYFAMGFVFVGLIFAAIGFLYPRDIQRDPQASARENEKIDEEYMALSQALNAIIITGMILIGLGGLILSALFTNSVVCRECHNYEAERRRVSSAQPTSTQSTRTLTESTEPAHNYGTVLTETSN